MNEIFEVAESEYYGRHLIALKDFNEGDLVYKESPLLVFPDFKRSANLNSEMYICLGCYMVVANGAGERCSRCRWPVCSAGCAQDDFHSNYECEVLERESIEYSRYASQFLAVIRALQLQTLDDSHKWNSIFNLSSNYGDPTKQIEKLIAKMTSYSYTFMNHSCGFVVNKELVEKIVRIILVNSFSIMGRDEMSFAYAGEALYSNVSLLAHSCSPNLDFSIPYSKRDYKERWKISLYAKRNILTGEALTIPYIQECMERGTLERRLFIKDHLHFFCFCERCRDFSERGTFFSALLCTACQNGVLVPENPLNFQSDWICVECDDRKSIGTVEGIEEIFDMDLRDALENSRGNKKILLESVGKMIEYSNTVYGLHPNHHLVIRAIIHWVVEHDMECFLNDTEQAEVDYYQFIQRAQRVIDICRIIGTVYHWAIMESATAMAIIRYKFKSANFVDIGKWNYGNKSKLTNLKNICTHLLKSIELLERQPYSPVYVKVQQMLNLRYEAWSRRLIELEIEQN